MKKLLLILPLLLFSCQSTPPNNNSSQTGIISTQNKGSLNVTVKDGITKQNISGATVKIILKDGNEISKTTDVSGKVYFDGIADENNYNVEISSQGYVTNSVSTASSNVIVKAGQAANLDVNLYKVIGTITGRIISDNNQPIEAAVINLGNDTALSDNKGNFNINVTNLVEQPVNIGKTGYKYLEYGTVNLSATQNNKNLGDIKISKIDRRPVVLFDISHRPFGNEGTDKLNSMSASIQEAGYQVSFENFFDKTSDTVDTLIIVSPTNNYSDDEINKIKDFVMKGKKIFVLGEWGGYTNFTATSINQLLKDANLKINIDLVKETDQRNYTGNDEQIVSSTIIPHFISKDINKLAFYSSASIDLINGGAKSLDLNITKLISLNSASGFKIQAYNQGQFGLLGVSTLGAGKVIVSGDSSMFSNADYDKNGRINLEEYDNKKLLANILNW